MSLMLKKNAALDHCRPGLNLTEGSDNISHTFPSKPGIWGVRRQQINFGHPSWGGQVIGLLRGKAN